MKERIEQMIKVIKSNVYDPEAIHGDYDKLLQEFILNYDAELLPLVKELIELQKEFWYA